MNTELAREHMVNQQVRAAEVLDPKVLALFNEVPREHFVPGPYSSLAFADTNIPLAHGQVMMTPQVEGRLLQALEISESDQALEIGTGSGFLTACLAKLARHVTSVDIHADLVETAAEKLEEIGVHNVDLCAQDVFGKGFEKAFDVIAVTGSVPEYDSRFQEWLKPGGRLFLICGEPPIMDACLIRRIGIDEWTRESLFETCIAPLENAENPEHFIF